MKYFTTLMFAVLAFFIISCGGGKDGDPVPVPSAVVPPVVVVTPPITGTGGGTTTVIKPQNDLYVNDGDQTNLNASLAYVSSKYALENLVAKTTYAVSYTTGGVIKGELRNLAQSAIPSESFDSYTRGYQPSNILPRNQAPIIADTASKVCMKFVDPAAKNASGAQIVQWLFYYNGGGAGDGELGIVSAAKLPVMTGAELTKLYSRNDYKALNVYKAP